MKEGAQEALNTINKWIIIGETLPSVLAYSAFLKEKINEYKEKYSI